MKRQRIVSGHNKSYLPPSISWATVCRAWNDEMKGWAENIRQINHKFDIVRIGIFWRLLHQWTKNIPDNVWVSNKAFWIENFGSQTVLNLILKFSERPNFEKKKSER